MLTNKSNLPEALVKAMMADPYNNEGSDFTATSLLKPARQAELQRRHKDEIEEDAEDSLYRLYGQIAHGIIERANDNDLAEKRFFAKFGEYKVSAQIDTLCLKNETLSDFKFTTSWGFKLDSDPKPEWVAQLNIQLEIMRQNGLDAKRLRIVGLLRDWQIKSAREDENYPRSPIAVAEIPMWSRKHTTNFINMRIAEHLAARKELPECSPDEKWQKPSVWAVVKRGQTRAIQGGVQFSPEAAEEIMLRNPGTQIVFRPGECIRCLNYCNVNKFCVLASIPKEESYEVS